MKYSIQLYSVRDHLEKDFEGTLKKIAEMGYSAVEFAGFYGRTPEQINKALKACGLEISGTHSAFDDLVERYDETVAFHKAIGNKNYIVPAYDFTDQDKLDRFVDKADGIIDKLAADGIRLSFHNHSREFFVNADGSVPYEQLLYRTGLTFEVDTYWAFVGMKNPVVFLNRIRDRLVFVHMRDGDPNGVGAPLGRGDAPTAEVFRTAVELGIPMVVENEVPGLDSLAGAEICINYLKGLEAAL